MSDNKQFVHLHVHTEFSLLDGLSRIKKLVARAKELEMPALAITDHGTMFGTMDFFDACTAAEIKPIIGLEAYLSPRGMEDRDPQLDRTPFHLLLLAKNMAGYKNLLKISSAAQTRGYYYRPRIDFDFLAEHSEGLIATSGCLAARIPRLVEDGRDNEAHEWIGQFQDVFGEENFYLELQEHDIDLQKRLNRWLIDYNRTNHTSVGLVATTDLHYVSKDDFDIHDTQLCIQTGSLKSDKDRLKFSDNSFYLYSYDEMMANFSEVPDAIHNSIKIAEMIEPLSLRDKEYHLPIFPVPDSFDTETYLRYLCEMGMNWRFGDSWQQDEVLSKRLNRELGIIHDMGFDTYFLIVWDLCEFARHADIWWNVRGSGAGSLAAYALGITNIDPIQNQLLFERFLNPGRISMPDVDLDYPDDRRGEMIAYAAKKYGEDKVAAIITFGTLGPKAAVRDVGRALDVPLADVNRAAALIPQEARAKPLMEYVENIPDLKKLYDTDTRIRQVIDAAKELQGIARHSSTHAAGVIIADKPLVEYIPLHRITGKDPSNGALKAVTQFPMETAESIGLLKVDFLGLSTLTILRKACELVERYHGIKYNMDNIPYRHDDPRLTPEQIDLLNQAFEMIGRGETIGVFQVESTGMQQMLRGMRPKQFENIVAAVSLYRPGPMEFIPQYNRRLHGEEEVTFHHEKLRPILDETYSIIVYQEQLMQIASDLFGYELGEADLMRRAVSKKKAKELQKHKAIFMERGPSNGISEDVAEKIFDEIEFFANYGFNKCVVGSTEIIDAETGRLIKVEDLASGKAVVDFTLSCDTDSLQLQPGRITAVMNNGVKPVYRLKTASGREIEATDNHPFYTFDGWRNLGELRTGEHIALPRLIPIEGKKSWDDYKSIILGHLLAEGNLCHPTGIYYYTGDEEQWNDYVKHLQMFDNTVASTHQRCGMYDVYSKRIDRSSEAGIVSWINELGLRNTDSHTKFIPDQVFELNNRQISLMISRMWEGDGHINRKGRSVYYATSSQRLAHQLQHLLLRLGILSHLREVDFRYRNDIRIGYQVFVTGNSSIKMFYDKIGRNFASQNRQDLLTSMILDNPLVSDMKDVIPLGVREIVRDSKHSSGLGWKEIAQRSGVSTSSFSRTIGEKTGFSHVVIDRLGDFFQSKELKKYSNSDIYWDRVVSIEYVDEKPTYDLTIDETHNFVANDIIVHNSHASDYAVITVQTAFLKCHYPEEYMTALLTVQRDDSSKVAHFLEECRRLRIPILPPDVSYSALDFDIQPEPGTGKRGVRFGLAAVKNAGANALQPIVDAREAGGEFNDLTDFCQRIDLRHVGRRTLESLIKVGAMKRFGSRAQLLSSLDLIMNYSSTYFKDKEVGQMSMFGDGGGGMSDDTLDTLPQVTEMSDREMLDWEKELLGLYVSGRPVDKYRHELSRTSTSVIQEMKTDAELYQNKDVAIAGEIVSFRRIYTKNNDAMVVIQLEDWHESAATIEVVLFPRTWANVSQMVENEDLSGFEEGEVVQIFGKFDTSRGDAQVIAERVTQRFEIVDMVEDDSYVPPTNNQAPAWADDEDDMPVPEEPEWLDAAPVYAPQPSVSNGKSPAWLEEDGYDEETGELKTEEAPHETPTEPEIKAENTLPSITSEPQIIPEIPPEYIPRDEDIKPLHVVVHLFRSGDDGKDRLRLRRLHGLLVSYPGPDRFSVIVEGADRSYRLEFPNETTKLCDELLNDLVSVVGSKENVVWFDL